MIAAAAAACPRSRRSRSATTSTREWFGHDLQHRHDLVDPGRRRASCSCSASWAARQLTKDTEDHVPDQDPDHLGGRRRRGQQAGRGQPRQGPPVRRAARGLAVLLHPDRELARAACPSELNDDTGTCSPAPTADTNLTYALAAVTIVSVWIYGIRQQGAKGYFKHFLEPFPVLLPLNILEELVKPITLALRLFGNIFAGGIMLALIGLIPLYGALGAEHPLEAVRHVHRRHPGLHLRAADHPVLRDGRRRARTTSTTRADEHEPRTDETPQEDPRTRALTAPVGAPHKTSTPHDK